MDLGAAEDFFDELMEKHESAQREAEEKLIREQEMLKEKGEEDE